MRGAAVASMSKRAFFDATYIQVSIGYMFINGGHLTTTVNGSSSSSDVSGSLSYLTFAAYLKYPFDIGPIELFPLLGIEYRQNLTDKDARAALSAESEANGPFTTRAAGHHQIRRGRGSSGLSSVRL